MAQELGPVPALHGSGRFYLQWSAGAFTSVSWLCLIFSCFVAVFNDGRSWTRLRNCPSGSPSCSDIPHGAVSGVSPGVRDPRSSREALPSPPPFSIALWDAAFRGAADVLTAELQHGADVNQRLAASNKGLLHPIIARGAPLRGHKDLLLNRLHGDYLNCLLTCVHAGCNVNAADRDGFTPLMAAVTAEWDAVAVLMALQPTTDLHAMDKRGRAALTYAADAKRQSVAHALSLAAAVRPQLRALRLGATVGGMVAADVFPFTDSAAWVEDRVNKLRALAATEGVHCPPLQPPALVPPPTGVSVDGARFSAALVVAARSGTDVRRALGGADPPSVNQRTLLLGDSPLCVATYMSAGGAAPSHARNVVALVERGADVNAASHDCVTPLMHAVLGSWLPGVAYLALQPNCNVLATDRHGKSAVQYAAGLRSSSAPRIRDVLDAVVATTRHRRVVALCGGLAGVAAADVAALSAHDVSNPATDARIRALTALRAVEVPPELDTFLEAMDAAPAALLAKRPVGGGASASAGEGAGAGASARASAGSGTGLASGQPGGDGPTRTLLTSCLFDKTQEE